MKKKISIILLSLALLTACGKKGYEPGSHQGQARGYNEDVPIKVLVQVDDKGQITSIQADHNDDKDLAQAAISQLTEDVIEANSYQVDHITEATATSKGFLMAVEDALNPKKK